MKIKCQAHSRRVFVLPSSTVHRGGSPCGDSIFMLGNHTWTADEIRHNFEVFAGDRGLRSLT